MMKAHRIARLSIVTVASVALASCITIQGPLVPATPLPGLPAEGIFQRDLSVSGPVDLDVTTGAGNVTVSRGAVSTVHVVGTVRAWNAWVFGPTAKEHVDRIVNNPPIEQSGSSIRIGHSFDPGVMRDVS